MEKFHTLKCLQQESMRLKTFQGWPKTTLKPSELAKCGFYYLHYLDYTQCFFCRGVVGCWDASDVPLVEHKRHFPNCPFLSSPDATGNIPMDSSPLSHLMEEYLNYKLEYHKPHFPKQTSNSSADRPGSEGSMRVPQYATPKSRQDSFTSARKDVFPDHVSMVNAGFFYSGVSDFVVCFHCGGGLFNWSLSDDPWAQHAKAYSFCPFLGLNQQHWQPQPRQHSVPLRSPKLSERETSILMTAPIVKRLLRLGMGARLVQGAFAEAVEERAVLPVSENEALELVSKWANKHQMDVDDAYNGGSKSPIASHHTGPGLHKTPRMPEMHQQLSSFNSSHDESKRPIDGPFISYSERKNSNLNSSTEDFGRSGISGSPSQPYMFNVTEMRSNAAQSHTSNTFRNMHQIQGPLIFNSARGFSTAEVLSTVKKEGNEVEIMESVSPRPYHHQTMRSQPLLYPLSRPPSIKQGDHSMHSLSRGSPSEMRNQLDFRQPHSVRLQQEVGSRFQETAKNDRIRQLLSELEELQTPDKQRYRPPQFPFQESRRNSESRQITQTEVQELTREVMKLRRRVQEMKQRNSCRSCLGGAPASVMLLPCNHLHLCRVCSVVCTSCPTCHGPIRGTVLPIRERLIT